jgi:membrane protein required for colicin V production
VTWLDYAVLGVFALSMAWGAWRGLVREVLSILAWVIAFLAANLFAAQLGPAMPREIPTPEMRIAVAFVLVFLVALLATSLVALLLSKIVSAVGLGGVDRMLGAGFGAARALLIVLAAALLAGLTAAPRQPYWRESVSGPLLARAVLAVKPLLPPTFTERLRYD